MGMKSYKPVYDGVKFKSPMQRMLEEQRAKELAQAKKEVKVKEEETKDGNTSNGRKKSES